MSHPLPPKKEVALALLERSSVHVHLDPRAPGVVVPLFLKSQPQLVLQIGLNMKVPIPDLRLDEAGMTCTLSFNRSPFYCVIPWGSIFAMIGDDGRGMIWKDDVPPEVAKPSQARPAAAAPAEIAGRPLRAAPDAPEEGAEVAAAKDGKSAGDAKAKTAKKTRKRVERASASSSPREGRSSGSSAGTREASARGPRGGLSAVPSPAAEPERPARKGSRESAGATDKRPAPRPAAAPAASTRDEMPPPAGGGERDRRIGPTGPSNPGGSSRPPQRPGGPPRPKRELPPYLRVVK